MFIFSKTMIFGVIFSCLIDYLYSHLSTLSFFLDL